MGEEVVGQRRGEWPGCRIDVFCIFDDNARDPLGFLFVSFVGW